MPRDFLGDLNIVILYAEIFLLWILSIYFFRYVIKKRGFKQIAGNFALATCVFFFSFSLYKFFSMVYTHYYPIELLRVTKRIILLGGVFLMIVILNQVFFPNIFPSSMMRRLYFISLLAATLILTGFYYLHSNLITLLILLLFFGLLASVLMYYSAKWFFKMGRFIKTSMTWFFIGASTFLIGTALSRIIPYVPSFSSFLIATNGLELLGLTLISGGLIRLRNLIEFEWKLKILQLYIIHHSGLVVFERSFRDKSDLNPILAEGGITGIVNAIKEMTKSEKRTSIIRQGDRNILLEYGEHVNVVLIAEEELGVLRSKMRELLHEFESVFKHILSSWKGGNTTVFLPAKILIENIFE